MEDNNKGGNLGLKKWMLWSGLVMFVILLFGPGNNIIRWAQAGYEISQQEKRIDKYEREIAAMNDSIRLLHSNRDSLEKYARETFHFAAPGDDVYIIED
jgi:cell division protein FtsB